MLRLKNVRYCPEGSVVLDGIDLHIEQGEVFVVMGTSGAGKTTILRLLNGLIQPDQGSVEVEGQDISALREWQLEPIRRKVGMVFQSAALFDSLTVAENVGFAWRKQRLSKTEFDQRVRRTLDIVGLQGIEDRMPAELSGGMKKRVGLARTIAMNPEVLLYDEPTSGLDPVTSGKILDLILDLQRRLHVTSVVVTHDLAAAYRIADRVALLSGGRIVFVGSVEAMKTDASTVVHQFVHATEHTSAG